METNEFIRGFAETAKLNPIQASEQWAAYSRQLSDSERESIEAGGYNAGLAHGEGFAALYPETIR